MDYRHLWQKEHSYAMAIAANLSPTKLESIQDLYWQLLQAGATFPQAKAALQELLA